MIEIQRLAKSFSEKVVFRSDYLKTEDRGMISLTGENGSGKSTLLKILATLMLPSEGTVTVAGKSLFEYSSQLRKEIGYAQASEVGFFPRLTGRENLLLFASLRKVPKQTNNFWQFFPQDALNTPFYNCSSGMKQALILARAVQHEPKILLLDEMIRSFDSTLRAHYLNFLHEYGKNHLIISATHDEQEISISSSKWIMKNGILFS